MIENTSIISIVEFNQENIPLPEIVLPLEIREERANGIENLLKNPPAVDAMHVLDRSGTFAGTGLYEDGEIENRFNLPPLIPVTGIGNEVWNEWQNWMREQGREDEIPEEGIGYFAPDEDRVLSQKSPAVRDTVARLRALPSHMRNVAHLDDISQTGSVAVGVAPALYKAAYGEGFEYDPKNNRYLLKSSNWIEQIVLASFDGALDRRELKFLVEVAKGNTDWPNFNKLDSSNIRSLDQLAHYYATSYIGAEAQNISPESIYKLIEKYGINLFELHTNIKAVLKSHTKEVVK